MATADPGTLPDKATWYLVTNLPRPGGPREPGSPHPAAGLAELVRIYAIRNWIEQSYKQAKDELDWADFQVRSDLAIRRHQVLVNCAFCFCWAACCDHPAPRQTAAPQPEPRPRREGDSRAARVTNSASLASGAAGSLADHRVAHPQPRRPSDLWSLVKCAWLRPEKSTPAAELTLSMPLAPGLVLRRFPALNGSRDAPISARRTRTEPGGSRSRWKLRSVTDYDRNPAWPLERHQAGRVPVLAGYRAAPAR